MSAGNSSRPRIPHSRPTLPTAEEWAELTAQLHPGWVADGPLVRQFEAEIAPWLGGVGAVAVNSGTNALQLAMLAVGVRPGSAVLVPAYCCAALLNAIHAVRARPVLVDSEPGGHNLSLESAHRQLTPDVAAAIIVHTFGDPVDTAAFRSLGVPLIDDCAQALGAGEPGALVGGKADVAIGSFYATKVMTTGHGGIVTSPDAERVARVRDLVEYDNRDEWEPRFSYGFTEMQAALGLWQLARLSDFLARRRTIADYYSSRFSDLRIAVPITSRGEGHRSIAYRYTLRAHDANSAIAQLQARGIDAKRPVFRPLHQYLGLEAPAAQAAHEQIVSLPIYPSLTDTEAEAVVEAVAATRDCWLSE